MPYAEVYLEPVAAGGKEVSFSLLCAAAKRKTDAGLLPWGVYLPFIIIVFATKAERLSVKIGSLYRYKDIEKTRELSADKKPPDPEHEGV